MKKSKIAITIDEQTLNRVDLLVRTKAYPNRSRAIEEAVEEKLERLDRSRLARECAKLDAVAERASAEEGMSEELGQWPEY